jgi:spermidine synthase
MLRFASLKKLMNSPKSIGILVLCAFFFSGAAGLIHEVVWTRLLRLVMGNTVFSITTVLCAFMGGLAFGSYAGGRIIDRRSDPLRIFAVLEGTIALYCFALPWLISGAEPLYRFLYQHSNTSSYAFSLIRFFFSGVLLLVPATFMGATLPVLTRFFVRSPERIGWSVGTLYGINTFGAVVGACIAGFVLVPSIGVTKTIYTACLLNAAVSISAYRLYLRSLTWPQDAHEAVNADANKAKEKKKETENPPLIDDISVNNSNILQRRSAVLFILVGYGFAGFASLVYEIAWTRVFSMLIGSSTYAFTMILTAFIFGLAIGSTVCARYVDHIRDPLRALAIIEAGVGVSALVMVPFIEWLPFFVTDLISNFIESFWRLQVVEFAFIFLMMLVPTILMGMAFPLANRIIVHQGEGIGQTVGSVYGSNTIGNIIGSFIGGFVLIPLMGIQHTIFTAAAINIAVGILFWEMYHGKTPLVRRMIASAVVIVAAIAIFIIPPWSASNMSLGPFYAAIRQSKDIAKSSSDQQKSNEDYKILFHKEGVDTTVTVKQKYNGARSLYVNGKPDASTGGDLPTQEMLAHLPLLMHPNPRSALVIGLASGITLGSAGLYPLESLDCVEISPVMVEASHYFDDYNRRILNDPRVHLIIADGRNHLALTDKRYDVIISEPSNPWIAGISDLFTREYFQLCKSRLTAQGIVGAWVQLYNIDLETFRSIVYSFSSVFPNATLWKTLEGDCILIGKQGEVPVDYSAFLKRIGSPEIAADLKRVNFEKPLIFLSRLMMSPAGIKRLTERAFLHTDDNALVEFNAPRALTAESFQLPLIKELGRSWEADLSFLVAAPSNKDDLAIFKENLTRFIKARGYLFQTYFYYLWDNSEQGIKELRKVAVLHPSIELLNEYISGFNNIANNYIKSGYLEKAALLDKELLNIFPDYAELHFNLANIFGQQGKVKEADTYYSRALILYTDIVRMHPDDTDALYIFAELLVRHGREIEALNHYRIALKRNPELYQVMNNIAVILAIDPRAAYFNSQEAIRLAKRACELTSYKRAQMLFTLSIAYASAGQLANSKAAADMALYAARTDGDQQMAELIQKQIKNYQ